MDSPRQACARTSISMGQLSEQMPHCTQREGSGTTCPAKRTVRRIALRLKIFRSDKG
jgi:hypothetical protein